MSSVPTPTGSREFTLFPSTDVVVWAAGEGAAVTLRFLVYLDLLLLAGLSLCARRTMPVEVPARAIVVLAVTGVMLTLTQFLATALAMTGGDMAILDAEMLRYLAFETPMGLSSIARFLFLVLIAATASMGSHIRSSNTLLAFGALATLAWGGHAGASEGGIGALHRASDILHLIAASAWLGTLALLLLALARSSTPAADLIAALRRFALTGTLIVGALFVTGIINLWAITGLDALPELATTDYGRTLGLKLALFAAMLGFAAFNRWLLTPRLEQGARNGLRRLRTSASFEAALAVGVVLAVAILGTRSPTG